MMTGIVVTSLALDAEDHAVQYRVMQRPDDPEKPLQIIPFTLWPSRFPKMQFDFIIQLQEDYNLLIHKISQDRELLMGSLQQ